MNDPIESRLRATYAAVADQTVVTPRDMTVDTELVVGLVPLAAPGNRRRRWLVVTASAAAIGAAVFLAAAVMGRDTSPTAAIETLFDTSDRAILSHVPDGFGLVEIGSSDTGNRLVYTDGASVVTLTTTEDADLPQVAASEVDASSIRWTDADGAHVAWTPRPRLVVEVSVSGPLAGSLAMDSDVVANVLLVSTDAWDELRQESGFAETDGLDRAAYSTDFPDLSLDGEAHDGPLHREVQGSLQEGVSIFSAGRGLSSVGAIEPASVSVASYRPGFLVSAGSQVRTVEIVLDGEVVLTVDTVADPASPRLRVASFVAPPGVSDADLVARGWARADVGDHVLFEDIR